MRAPVNKQTGELGLDAPCRDWGARGRAAHSVGCRTRRGHVWKVGGDALRRANHRLGRLCPDSHYCSYGRRTGPSRGSCAFNPQNYGLQVGRKQRGFRSRIHVHDGIRLFRGDFAGTPCPEGVQEHAPFGTSCCKTCHACKTRRACATRSSIPDFVFIKPLVLPLTTIYYVCVCVSVCLSVCV